MRDDKMIMKMVDAVAKANALKIVAADEAAANFAAAVKHQFIGFEMQKAGILDKLNALDLKVVKVEKMDLDDWAPFKNEPHGCYNAAFDFIANNPHADAKYCVGYGESLIPIDHAWVKIGDKYFDPSWQANVDEYDPKHAHYIPLMELYIAEALFVIEHNNWCPPAAIDIINLIEKGDLL